VEYPKRIEWDNINKEASEMRKVFFVLLVVAILFVSATTIVLAGGGQNCMTHRGDNGNGSVVQNQFRLVP